MSKTFPSLLVGLAISVTANAATTYTYSYDGPTFRGGTDHVAVSFTTSAPLAPSKSYLSQAAASVTAGSVSATGPAGPLVDFTLPITAFQIHTDAAGAIDSWYIFGGRNTLTGTSPTMTGTDWQAYTMNTLVFIPGSDVPGATGLVTGHYNYDQATEVTFYASCTGAPAGCTLAGNGQPYVYNYAGNINPAGTNGGWWRLTTNTTNPPPPPPPAIVLSGSLPAGQVNVPYSAALTATGGTAPYAWTWQVTPTAAGLAFNPDGTVSGTPTAAGSYSVVATATDNTGATAQASYTLSIALPTCANTNAVITSVGRDFIVVNGGLKLADHVWYTPTPAGTTFTGGTTGFVTGELVDYTGTLDPVSGCHASAMTVKPAPTLSCAKPTGAKSSKGKAIVSEVGFNYIVAGGFHIDYAACTALNYGGNATAPVVGDKVEWEGYVEPNLNVMAKTLSFN